MQATIKELRDQRIKIEINDFELIPFPESKSVNDMGKYLICKNKLMLAIRGLLRNDLKNRNLAFIRGSITIERLRINLLLRNGNPVESYLKTITESFKNVAWSKITEVKRIKLFQILTNRNPGIEIIYKQDND